MELKDTVKGMMSDDCKERMAAEYHQTKIRYEKLKKLNTRISRQTTQSPLSSNASHRLLPINPAPPVTNTFLIIAY